MKNKILACLTLIFCVFTIQISAQVRKEIPLKDFFKNPDKAAVKISPNGKYISYLEPWQNRLNVFVKNLDTNEIRQITNVTKRDILFYDWKGGDSIIYMQDNAGDENFHIYSSSLNSNEMKDLTPFEDVKCSVIDMLDDIDNKILIQMNKHNKQVFDVYKLNVNTGDIELIEKNPGDVVGWLSDHNGNIRIAMAITDGTNQTLRYKENGSWQDIFTSNFKEGIQPLFFTFDNENLYVTSNVDRDKTAIYEYDLKEKKLSNLIFENRYVDVYNLIASKKRKKITAASYTTDKTKFAFFDKERKKIQKFVDEKLLKYENYFVSCSDDETKFIVHSVNDRTRGSYYLFDSKNFKLEKLFDGSPWLHEEDLAKMIPISYKARDGLIIHGYLTLPVDKSKKPVALVVHPHGGPWVRDYWGFNPEVQFLANQGYAVLQMNYRGSTGYGKKFLEASFKQWGLKMQDDITDGVLWSINQKIADSKKIAIYGASYGGYATLMGIVKTPNLYAAAIDYVGVSNLFTLLETLPPYWETGREQFYEMMGDPKKDKEQLIKTSPALNADKIKTPLLIAQGANDPRVKKSESDQMVEALKTQGIEVEYMVKDNEGHGFHNEENKFDFYRAMQRFLNKYIGDKKAN